MNLPHNALVILVAAAISPAAMAQTAAVNIPLMISDGVASRVLFHGLDPAATDGIDRPLGESEQPPLPPHGVFDARFIGTDISIPIGGGLIKDYRAGGPSVTGTRIHELLYQVGSGTVIHITWALPNGVSGRLQDLITGNIINVVMSGAGSYTLTNPAAFNKLKMTITYSFTSNVTGRKEGPAEFALYQNYPNPFNATTIINFQIPNPNPVSVIVQDMLGREVAALMDNAQMDAGSHTITWNAANSASGVYFVVMRADGFSSVKRMLLLK